MGSEETHHWKRMRRITGQNGGDQEETRNRKTLSGRGIEKMGILGARKTHDDLIDTGMTEATQVPQPDFNAVGGAFLNDRPLCAQS